MDQHADWKLSIRTPQGHGVASVGLDDPWSRLWRLSATSGKPTAKWKGIGFRHLGLPYSLGFFAASVESKRLLWFPTAEAKATMYDQDRGGQFDHYLGRTVDHLTLDSADGSGRHRSHFTYVDGTHGPRVSHFPNPGQLLPWFSLFLPCLEDHLRVVPESLTIRFPAVRTDSNYPPQLAGEGAWEIVDARPAFVEPHFVQFDVWAAMWPDSSDDEWGYMPAAKQLGWISTGPDILSRALGWSFDDDRGLVIVMSWVPGVLDRPRILRPSRIVGDIPRLEPNIVG